jgi:hypothetical protein
MLRAGPSPFGFQIMTDDKRSSITPLLITGLLAILGTVAGGVIKGYWDNRLAEKKFQTDLVMKALEPDDEESRINALLFMIDTRLVDNEELGEALKNYLADKSRPLPQFQPAGGGASTIIIPQTPETAGFSDYDVFVCDAASVSQSAEEAEAVVKALQTTGSFGEIRKKTWNLYSEVSLDTLMNKTTIVLDEIESGERSRLESALAGMPSPLQFLPNAGRPTPWRISVIVCPIN